MIASYNQDQPDEYPDLKYQVDLKSNVDENYGHNYTTLYIMTSPIKGLIYRLITNWQVLTECNCCEILDVKLYNFIFIFKLVNK